MPGVLAHQLDGVAVIAPGALGAPFTGTQRDALVPQLLLAVTHILPVLKAPNDAVILVLPLPPIPVPAGAVQLYVVPGPCDGQSYSTDWLHKPVNAPVMLDGTVGKPGATVLHLGADVIPHTLVTLTHMLPTAL